MYNKVILIGRMTADPELKQTPSGVFVTSFRLAVDRRFKSQDGERKADFLTVICWRQVAEFVAKHFRKGDPMGIEGSIQTRDYEDRKGNKRTAVEIVAEQVFFVGGSKSHGDVQTGQEGHYNTLSANDFEEVEPDGDLPF